MLTDRVGALTTDYFVNLLDMTTVWEPVLIMWAWIGEDLGSAPGLRTGDQGRLPPGAFDGIDIAGRPGAPS